MSSLFFFLKIAEPTQHQLINLSGPRLRYCHTKDRSFTFHKSKFCGVRIGIWAIFGLFLETFLNLSHLCLFLFSLKTPEPGFFQSAEIPKYGIGFVEILLATVVLQIIILPFGFIGFLTLNRRLFSLSTIFTLFQSLLFFVSGFLGITYQTVTATKPMAFLGIQLLFSVPIHLFCAIIFLKFTLFTQFHSESIKKSYDFGNFVERTYFAMKKQKNQLYRQSRIGGKFSSK
uniref:Uncharacterized protein n=1 Tax=Panagrolaimus sp. PS1159 TaxID=55785 RepID=A0AC35GTS2_9BILA